jgi:hypothetical protein
MGEPHVITICVTAFVAVFAVLLGLALMIRLITVVFPQDEEVGDAAMAAAIGTAVAAVYPGARVTRIEEQS